MLKYNYRYANKEKDSKEIWEIMEQIIRDGETFPYSMDMKENDAIEYWFSKKHTFVCLIEGTSTIVGTFYVTDNQPCLGAHVANIGIMVSSNYYRKGVGSAMGRFCVEESLKYYIAIQCNLVVVDNLGSMKIWERLGFEKKCVLEKSFKSRTRGYVDACVFYKYLAEK